MRNYCTQASFPANTNMPTSTNMCSCTCLPGNGSCSKLILPWRWTCGCQHSQRYGHMSFYVLVQVELWELQASSTAVVMEIFHAVSTFLDLCVENGCLILECVKNLFCADWRLHHPASSVQFCSCSFIGSFSLIASKVLRPWHVLPFWSVR